MANTTDQIQINLSKKKLILLLIGSIAFVLTGIWLFTASDHLSNWQTNNPGLIKIVSIIGIIFFGVCTIFISRKLFDTQPGLIIDSLGINDNSSGIRAGQILWSDMNNIEVIEIQRQKIIMVHVKNPQEYIDKQTNRFKRKMMQMNFNMFGTPLSITSNALQIKHEELIKILRDNLKASRQKQDLKNEA